MAFDPTFQDHLPVLCRDLPYLNPEIPTMFSSPTSVLIPPPHNNPLLNHTNTFHHIQDNTLNMPTHNPNLLMEVLSSVSNPINIPSIPYLGESSQPGSQSDFVNPNPMIPSQNNKTESLYDHQGGTFIWDFEQKASVQSSAASASSIAQMGPLIVSQPPPPVDSREIELVKRALFEGDLSYLTEIFGTNIHAGEQRKNVQAEGDINTANINKGHWSKQEDRALVELVKQFGQSKWSKVAKLMKKRLGRQCRERWHNHLRPEIKKRPWTIIEDLILIKSHQELGNKWEEIAKRLPGRSGNTIMNHWNTTKRCRNIFKKPETYDGSMLQAYIKRVTASKESTRETKKKKPINKMKMKEAMHTKLNEVVVNGNVDGIESGSVMDGGIVNGSTIYGPFLKA